MTNAKRTLGVWVFLGWAIVRIATASAMIPVSVDPRVELISIIFRLAGSSEYNQCGIPSYSEDIRTHFASLASHPVVELARNLRATRGVGFDAPMGLAVHLSEGFDLQPRLPLNPLPPSIDKRWTPESIDAFCLAARQFSKESGFPEFFARHQALYDRPVREMQTVMAKDADLDWFSRFFSVTSPIQFRIILGMNNGGSCYGPHFQTSDRMESYSILGVWDTDAQGQPTIDASVLPTIIHEFCHSFANPVVDRHLPELEPAGQTLFGYVRATLEGQAYGNWKTMLRETLVRASVIRYFLKQGKADVVKEEIQNNLERGFPWIKDLVDLLDRYEADRQTYPDLHAFVPVMVEFFNGYQAKMAALEAEKPHVTSMSPENDAGDVDPGLAEVRVTFDRPMAKSFSWCGGGKNYPGSDGDPSWSADRKTCVLPVKLQPNWDYVMFLNSGEFQGFASDKGVPLTSVKYRFSTLSGNPADDVAPEIASLTPANGATDVDPGVVELRATFSVPMDKGYAWCGDGEDYPESPQESKPSWHDEGRTCVLPVSLKPGVTYRLFLNAPGIKSFRSRKGVPLKPVAYTFTTKAKP